MHEGDVPRGAFGGQRGGGRAVDARGLGLLLLRAVDGGPGGGVDDGRRRMGGDLRDAGGGVGLVGLRAAEEHRLRGQPGKFRGDLAGLAEDEKGHATPSRFPTPSRLCSASHQSRLSRYHWTVRSSPSSTVTLGRQPSSARIRDGSIA